jgi:bis(5'-adenosyl)-triphosphatase
MTETRSDTQCPFCSPAIDATTFAESERFRAIYNIAPILPGHSLIVPKQHKAGILDLDASEVCEFAVFGRKVTEFLEATFKSDGFNWTIQDGESGGQTVPHLHLHLIPRHSGDLSQPGEWYPLLRQSVSRHIDDETRVRLAPEQMRAVVDHLRSAWMGYFGADSGTR